MTNIQPGINWNAIDDEMDLTVWNKLITQFWTPEKIAMANDIPSWEEMSRSEREATVKVLTGLTVLDTLQNRFGALTLMEFAQTLHEEAVYTNIAFMEAIHAKSYSSIFSTLCTTKEIEETFQWAEANEELQKKANIIHSYYVEDDPLKKFIASTLLESFLFYSGFYLPLYWSTRGKLTNTADMIKLIIRDECCDSSHTLLTPEGWKPIAEITVEDRVAQYREDGSGIEFVNPIKTSSHEAPYVWEFESEQGHVRQVVSGNHRMYLERRPYGKGTEHSSEIVRADDLPQSRLNGYARFVNAGYKQGGRDTLTVEERLLIAISADGSFNTSTVNAKGEPRRNGEITGHIPCVFNFSKKTKIERLKNLAKEAGWELREGVSTRAKGNTKEKQTLRLMVPVGVDRSKLLSRVSELEEVSYLWAQEFIEELSLWDGHIVKANPENITWGSVVESNAEYVQAVAALAGYRTHFRKIEDDRSETFSDYYRVQINKGNRYSGAQRIVKTKGEGRTMYGVEVPSGLLLTRNNGSVTVTGNSVHGFYIGYKYQNLLKETLQDRKDELQEFTYGLLMDLYENEVKYTHHIYDSLGRGISEDVLKFLRYNANKALMNLGYDSLFPTDQTNVSPAVMAALSTESENHDFFSGSGSSYVIGKAESTEDEDWGWN